MAEQQVELIRDVGRAYAQMSLPALSNLLHSDYVHVTRPQSLNIPRQNKAEYLEYIGKAFDGWTKVETRVIKALTNSPGKIVVHLAGDVTLKSGSTVAYESFVDYHIGEDANGDKKITYADEFVDANYRAQSSAST